MSAIDHGYRRDAIVLNVAIGIVGVTFGVLAESAGLSVVKATLMSLLVLTGASQFAAVSSVKGGGSAVAAVGGALLLGARNMLYGPVVAPFLRGGTLRRAVAAQFVIDETTGMATAQPDRASAEAAFWFTGISLGIMWVGGTAAGAALGGSIGNPDALGLDAAFPAAFVALLAPHVKARPGRVAAAAGAAIALVAIPLAPRGVPILLAALGVLAGYVVLRRSWRAAPGAGPADAPPSVPGGAP